MSSRPECEICCERVSMGGCSCGKPYFGRVWTDKNGERQKERRAMVHVNNESTYGWVQERSLKELQNDTD